MKATASFLALLLLSSLAWSEPSFTSLHLARWSLANGKYEVDAGRYLEAIESFDTTIESTELPDLDTDAMLQKANVLAVYLEAPEDAVRIYQELLRKFPGHPAAEAALMRIAVVLFNGEDPEQARTYLQQYLRRYPEGSSRHTAEFLLKRIPGRPAPAVEPRPRPAVEPERQPPVMHAHIGEVRIRVMPGRSRVRVESPSGLRVEPLGLKLSSVDISASGSGLSVNGRPARSVRITSTQFLRLQSGKTNARYRGSVTVSAKGRTLQIVNRVGMEDYLYGVVTRESPSRWPVEALKAQAIASRTYALYQVQHRKDSDYDMVDDEGSQVYGGMDGETAAGRRAVDMTRGQVLTHRSRPILAMYSSNAGWATADPAYIFNQPLPYLGVRKDPFSVNQPFGKWSKTFTANQVRSALSRIAADKRIGPIRDILPVRGAQCPSGRLIRVDVVDDVGTHRMRTRTTLARALGLPEILLSIRKSRNGNSFTFEGGGFGHGVGMSQWGAKAMADSGKTAPQILDFYYDNTRIETVVTGG